jgi:serine/threonine-protein kinase HipA
VTNLLGGLSISPVLEFDRRLFKAEFSQKFAKGMSISGVQKKLSVKAESGHLVPTNLGGRFILKPSVDEFPEISANEHLTMKLGALFGIDTPPCGLLQFKDGELVYIVKRFDWMQDGSGKILKEDMAQIFQLQRDSEETYKYSKSYEEVGVKIREVTGGKLMSVLDFFRRVVFCFLSGNGDYHLKNISVQNATFDPRGGFDSLTPNYDAVMTSIYLSEESELALPLLFNREHSKEFESVGFLTKPDFDLFAERIQLTSQGAGLVYQEMKKRLPEAMNLVEQCFLTLPLKEKYKTTLRLRAAKLGLVD